MNSRSLITLTIFTLLLPGASTTVVASDWIYYARQGDTLWDLCLEYTNKRGCWIELAKYNGVGNDRAIPVGKEIRIPTDWLAQPPVVGNVVAVSGAVSYYRNQSTSASPLRAGQELHLGARLVSEEGSARLLLGASNELLLRSNSVLELDTMSGPSAERSSAELALPRGAVEVTVKPGGNSRFRITTPAAIAAVRGTQYRVNSLGVEGSTMRSEVLSGSVEVASGTASKLVPKGFGVATRKGEAPGKPRKLLAAPVFELDYSSLNLPVTIAWDSNPDAKSWLLDLVEDGPSGSLLESYSTDNPIHTFDTLAEGCYKLEIRAIDKDGFNGFNSMTPLCIVPQLPAVSLSGISWSATGDHASFSWPAVTGAQKYRVEIASDVGFTNIIDTQVTGNTEIVLARSSETAFSIRVIAIDAAGNESPASTSRDFKPKMGLPWQPFAMAFIVLLTLL